MPEGNFRPWRQGVHVQMEELDRLLPPNATTKGMFLEALLAQARDRDAALTSAGLQMPRTGFGNVDHRTYMRLHLAVGSQRREAGSNGDALRQQARPFYTVFANSLAGKVIFGVLGRDPSRIFPAGYKGWQLSNNFGTYAGRTVAPRVVELDFFDYPAVLVETTDLGSILGAVDVLGVKAAVTLRVRDEKNTTVRIAWD